MRELTQIQAVYLQIDADFEAQRINAASRDDLDAVEPIASKQRINDQAYFVLYWGQLETVIDDTCRDAIRRRQSSGNWTVRRAWDLYNPDDLRSQVCDLKIEQPLYLIETAVREVRGRK